ncbi:hypothetical protein B0H14DRAFT_2567860 [Mycena olivaceomarginata]|nr:hypothetical protein B0H14DRAFT_2567860 [Mycena olivaceomarginata]
MAKALVHPPPLPGPQYKLHHGGAHLWNLRISAILTLHVYALFNCNRVILGLLSLGGLGFLAIGAVCAPTEDERKRRSENIWGCCTACTSQSVTCQLEKMNVIVHRKLLPEL